MSTTLLIGAFVALSFQDPSPHAAGAATATRPVPPEMRELVDFVNPNVGELRGLPFKHDVPVGLNSADDFMAYMEKSMAGQMTEDELAAWEDSMVLLGIAEPGTSIMDSFGSLLHGTVGGYYDYQYDKKFYMIDTYSNGMMGEIIMAHELCHALEDQHYDLGKMMENVGENADRMAAVGAVIEGSATVLMNQYALKVIPEKAKTMSSEERAAFMSMDDTMDAMMSAMGDAPPLVIMMLNWPYIEGSRFISRSQLGTGAVTQDDWNQVWEDPPASSEQILHPEKYWCDPALRDMPIEFEVGDLSGAMTDGWRLLDENTGGETTACFVLVDDVPDSDDIMGMQTKTWTTPGTTGWGGDRMQVYLGPDDAQVILWATVWDTDEDREEFLDEVYQFNQPRNPFFKTAYAGTKGKAARTALLFFANEGGEAQIKPLQKAFLQTFPDWK